MRKFRVPNQLINNERLSLSARRLGAYLCAVSNRLGVCQKSIAMLAGLSGLSPATVQSAADELERAGVLTRQRKYRYDFSRQRLIFDRTLYRIDKRLPGGYTLVPEALFYKRELSSGAFVVALYLFQQGAGQGRAFPSFRRIVNMVGIAKSTICRALRQLQYASVFLVQNCVKRNRTFSSNSYFFLRTAPDQHRATRPWAVPCINCTIGFRANSMPEVVPNLASL